MDSKQSIDGEDEDELVFQDLMPEKPANAFQKRIIDIQQNWSSRWNKRRLLLLSIVLSCMLVFLLVFEVIQPFRQQNGTLHDITISSAVGMTYVWQVLPYEDVLYFLETRRKDDTGAGTTSGTLEAVDARTGRLVWSYANHNVTRIVLYKNILYAKIGTKLVALNATNRAPLWEKQMLSHNYGWQIEQGILFMAAHIR